jgi:hypothetical protein
MRLAVFTSPSPSRKTQTILRLDKPAAPARWYDLNEKCASVPAAR